MSDHHDAQDYRANGPAQIGFRTRATRIVVGGDFKGTISGVHGTGTETGVIGNGSSIATW